MRLSKILLLGAMFSGVWASEPNPPTWPSSVGVFGPEDDAATIQAAIDAAYATNGGHDPVPDNGEFSSARYAFFFKPGSYTVDVPVGFYTSVYGLGDVPGDVVFNGERGVYCEEGDYDFTVGALDTFWRSAENFRNEAAFNWWSGAYGMLWAVSQAAPLRRVDVASDLFLFQYTYGDAAGFASGGFMGNSKVAGSLQSGSQQQWMSRNVEIGGGFPNGVWNMVFVGCTGAPEEHCGNSDDGVPYVVEDEVPSTLAEKPFITVDSDSGLFYLTIPAAQPAGRVGVDWSSSSSSSSSSSANTNATEKPSKTKAGAKALEDDDLKVPFEEVYVADNATDTAATINAKLSEGLHVVLSPGIYSLDEALVLNTENQVLLGLGFATLVSAAGEPCIAVGDVAGVRVAGVLLQAGPVLTDALLVVGSPSSSSSSAGGSSSSSSSSPPFPGDASNPVVLSDVFARVGGPDGPEGVAQATSMVAVNAGNVVGDNLWLWRADHTAGGAPVTDGRFPVDHGLVVSAGADDVTMYSLACEHTLKDLTVWDGDGGATYFYQSELPYDVTQETFGDQGYVGYRVGEGVASHQGHGIGVYSYFRDNEVKVAMGISAPETSTFVSPFSVFLNGYGGIEHVLNEQGNATGLDAEGQAYVCD